MSTKLGMAKLYLHSEDFAKILNLEDENNLEIIKIEKSDTDNTIEFRIVTPIDNSKGDIVQAYNNHWDIRRRYVGLKDSDDSYCPITENELNSYSNEELGNIIKKSYSHWKKQFNTNEVVFKITKK